MAEKFDKINKKLSEMGLLREIKMANKRVRGEVWPQNLVTLLSMGMVTKVWDEDGKFFVISATTHGVRTLEKYLRS